MMSLIKKFIKYFMQKWLIFLLIIVALVFALLGYIIFQINNQEPPDFFSFENPSATYTIKKTEENYFVVFDAKPGSNKHYECAQVGAKLDCQWEDHDHIEILVANSNNNLDPFMGKNLKMKGDFVNTSKQCIAGKCGEGFGPFVGINIIKIEVLK